MWNVEEIVDLLLQAIVTLGMFNSLSAGYLPICVVTVLAAWFVSSIRSFRLRAVSAVLAPIAISMAWYFVPALMRSPEDGWIGWGLIATSAWSIVAVPVGIAATLCLSLVRGRRSRRPSVR